MKTPFGFVPLLEAIDEVTTKLGSRDSAVRIIAEACECGKLKAGYRSAVTLGADDLDPRIWQYPQSRMFEKGMVELVLPLLDDKYQPHPSFTSRCEREVFVRRDGLDAVLRNLEPTSVSPSRYPGDAALIEEGVRMAQAGRQYRDIARELAPRAGGNATLGSKEDRLRTKIAERHKEIGR